MEEDINKAIEYLENYKYDNDVYKAIQVLIKGYKELEEVCKAQVNKINNYEEWIKVGMIPKSKVREKIEKLKKQKEDKITKKWEMEDNIQIRINAYEELLEGDTNETKM